MNARGFAVGLIVAVLLTVARGVAKVFVTVTDAERVALTVIVAVTVVRGGTAVILGRVAERVAVLVLVRIAVALGRMVGTVLADAVATPLVCVGTCVCVVTDGAVGVCVPDTAVDDCVAVSVAVFNPSTVVADRVAVGIAVCVAGTVVTVRTALAVVVCVKTPINPVGVMVMKYMPVAATRVAAPGSIVAPYASNTAVFVGGTVALAVTVSEGVYDTVGVILTNRIPRSAMVVAKGAS